MKEPSHLGEIHCCMYVYPNMYLLHHLLTSKIFYHNYNTSAEILGTGYVF